MLNQFMPDFNLGVVGAWDNGAIWNALWGAEIPDIIRPTMLVLDSTGYGSHLYDTDPGDLPVVAVHKIDSFRSVYTKSNRVHGKYFKGYRFVAFGTMYESDAYLMLVFVEQKQ